jgi:putative ABC transport system permease protein
MDTHVWRNLRDALRSLRRTPAQTTVIVLTLALGIGVNAALFTLFRLFERPVPGPAAVVRFEARGPAGTPDYAMLSYPEYVHLREHATTLSAVAASHIRPVVVATGDPSQVPPLALGDFVTSSYFDAFAIPVTAGRAFARAETTTPDADPVAVLSHAFWQRHFGGRDVVGKSVAVNGVPVVVVGVTAPDFVVPGYNWKADLWLPLTMWGRLSPGAAEAGGLEWHQDVDRPWLAPVALLAPNRTLDEARAEMRVLLGQVPGAHARELAPRLDLAAMTIIGGPDAAGTGRTRTIAMAATAIVLLIVCTNIASLLLARAATARKEIAVRLCLGATRGRLLRQSLVESVLLTAIGASAGLLLAWWSLRAFLATTVFAALGRDDLAGIARLHVAPDLQVLAFTIGVSCLACLLFALLPAWRATSGDILPGVKGAAGVMRADGGRPLLRGGLVVAQAALSLVLLIAAGLIVRGIDRARQVEPSLDPDRTVMLTVWMRQARYDAARAQQIYRDMEERLRAVPGVRAVGRTPAIGGLEEEYQAIEVGDGSASGTRPGARGFVISVTPGYLDVVDAPIVRGRPFTEDERLRGDAVVVTESLAGRLWPNRDALGQQVAGVTRVPARVVGVARDTVDAFGEPRALLYTPLDPSDEHQSRARIFIRTSADARRVLSAIEAAAHAAAPSVHMTVETMAAVIEDTSAFRLARTASGLSGGLGLLALTLAALGVYGVMAFMVSRRRREIGLRIAIGAQPRDVRRLVLGYGLRLGALGVAIGLAGGAAMSGVLSSILFGLSPLDPVAYAAAAALLLVVIFAVCLVPASRAARVDPIGALRE